MISAVALVHLHRAGGQADLNRFVGGYTQRVVGKAFFASVFALLVTRWGVLPTLGAALVAGLCAMALLSGLQRRRSPVETGEVLDFQAIPPPARGPALAMGADLLSAAARGLIAAQAVAALLLVARQGGRGMAGLLAGLPTVTGPALVWLVLDQGPVFAPGQRRCRGRRRPVRAVCAGLWTGVQVSLLSPAWPLRPGAGNAGNAGNAERAHPMASRPSTSGIPPRPARSTSPSPEPVLCPARACCTKACVTHTSKRPAATAAPALRSRPR